MFVDKKHVLRFLDSIGAAKYDSDGATAPRILRKANISDSQSSSTSPASSSSAPTTTVRNENRDPNKNKRGKKGSSVSSSSLKAIAKAGNRGGRPPIILTTTNTTKQTPPPTPPPTNEIQRQELSYSGHAFKNEKDNHRAIIFSPVLVDKGERTSMMLDESYDSAIPIEAIPIPGFPTFSDFGSATSCRSSDTIGKGCCISPTMDDATIATSSVVTSTSISSSSSSSSSSGSAAPDTILEDDAFQNAPNNDEIDDILLALAGCAPRSSRHHTGIDDSYFYDHEDDRLLSGLLICDDDDDEFCNSDEGRNKSRNSACSMLTYSSSHSAACIGMDIGNCNGNVNVNANCNDSGSTTHQASTSNTVSSVTSTTTYLMPSFFETITSLTSVSSLGAPARPGKNGMFLESSSLLQGPELEMATILESVLDCIFLPDDGDKNTIGGDDDHDDEDHHHHDDGVVQTKNLDTSHFLYHEISNYPCPTPQELLLMDWNHLSLVDCSR